jgi:hypothetical protein
VKNLFTGNPLEVFKSSHLCPCLPLPWNRRQRRARRRRGEARKQTSEGVCNWAHHGVIAGGSSAGAVAGERRRRHRGSTAVAARSPARGKARLSNTRLTRLQCDLEEMLRGPIGLESRRGHGSARLARRRPRELEFWRAGGSVWAISEQGSY